MQGKLIEGERELIEREKELIEGRINREGGINRGQD